MCSSDLSTAFDMTVMNELDRFHLVIDVCNKVETECNNVDSATKWSASYLKQEMEIALLRHKKYIREYGVDMDEVKDWKWDV